MTTWDWTQIFKASSGEHSTHIKHIYMCVCVCVCVCYMGIWFFILSFFILVSSMCPQVFCTNGPQYSGVCSTEKAFKSLCELKNNFCIRCLSSTCREFLLPRSGFYLFACALTNIIYIYIEREREREKVCVARWLLYHTWHPDLTRCLFRGLKRYILLYFSQNICLEFLY